MDNEIDFNTDITKYAKPLIKDITINNITLTLDLTIYDNKKTIEVLKQWQTCLAMAGKGNLFKTKSCMVIIYCLLTNNCKVNTINDNKMDLDMYDMVLDRFQRLDVIDGENRFIKLRIFTVCNSLIVVDCKDTKTYKIYELHNLANVKEFYGGAKINFDSVVKDIKLEPKFVGKYVELEGDFKRLGMENMRVSGEDTINVLQHFLDTCVGIEKQIQREYGKFYKAKGKN